MRNRATKANFRPEARLDLDSISHPEKTPTTKRILATYQCLEKALGLNLSNQLHLRSNASTDRIYSISFVEFFFVKAIKHQNHQF